MEKSECLEICSQFALGEFVSADKVGGTRNLNYVFKTGRGKWLVRRRYEGYNDPERVTFDRRAAQYLSDNGVPVIPPMKGNSRRHDVYRFAEGRHLLDGNREDIIALAGSLAHLHHAGHSFQPRYEKLGPRGETDPERLLANIEKIQAESPDTADALAQYLKMTTQAAKDLPLPLYSSLPHTIVHGDIQPANILIKDGRVSAFVDLDWLAWRPRIYDLAFTIICCCARHEKPIGEGDIWSLSQVPELDIGTLQEFLACYEKSSMPLTPSEKAALSPQLALTWCHIRVDNSLKAPAAERRRFLTRGIESDRKPDFLDIIKNWNRA